MTDAPSKTTAQTIGAFYKELIQEGVPVELAWEVARNASAELINKSGLQATE